ncbi:MAG: ABC transporter permease [Rubrivivax sp.]
MSAFGIVFAKELRDALRDRRTMLMVLLSSVAMGPLMLVLMSVLFSDLEKSAESREIQVVGIEHAPTLRNYLERAAMNVVTAPADHERLIKDSKLATAVLVVPADFEPRLARGEHAVVEVVTSSGNQRAQAAVRRLSGLMRGFNEERRRLALAAHGVSARVLQAVEVEERDLADTGSRGSQLSFIVAFFVLSAVIYGCFTAALDTTAGERERGSLEPLLMTPASPLSLALGKWAAVSAVGMAIAVLSCFSFLPGQWLMQSDVLSAMFRFGPPEALWFLALLLPLAGALSGLLMAVAVHSRTVKEAQAGVTVVLLLVNLLPLVSVFGRSGEEPWHLWVPALAQITLMGRVLKGEALGAGDVLVPLLVSIALAAATLVWIARNLRKVAVK